jgi:hypothetical protein
MRVIVVVAAVVLVAAIGLVAIVLYGMVQCAEAQDENREDFWDRFDREPHERSEKH